MTKICSNHTFVFNSSINDLVSTVVGSLVIATKTM